MDEAATNRALATRLGTDFPLLADTQGKAALAFGAWDAQTKIALAATIVVAKGGELLYRKIGVNKNDRPLVDDVLNAVDKSKTTNAREPANAGE